MHTHKTTGQERQAGLPDGVEFLGWRHFMF